MTDTQLFTPAYLQLYCTGELSARAQSTRAHLVRYDLCARGCHVNRLLSPRGAACRWSGTAAGQHAIGGRMADRFGSPAIVRTGLALIVVGFLLLAAGAGLNINLIALILIVSYVGFSFIHASLAKTVSLALPRPQAGVGMGIYNLVFFTAGAFGAALASQMLELAPYWGLGTTDAFRLVFLTSALTNVLALVFFHRQFRHPAV